MPQSVYEQLVDALGARGGAVPAVDCKEFIALIEGDLREDGGD